MDEQRSAALRRNGCTERHETRPIATDELHGLCHQVSDRLGGVCPSLPIEVRHTFAVQVALAEIRHRTGRAADGELYELGAGGARRN